MVAGLGGGSSDAATTLLALNELWDLNLPREELAEVAAEVGSDVAFFLSPPAGWCTGRGEIVEPAALGEPLDFVVVKPPFGCSTAEVYQRLRLPRECKSGDAIRKALRRGNVDEIGRAMFNRLEEPAIDAAPMIADVLKALESEQPVRAMMSGSGSACFALCRDRREAMRVADAVREISPAGTAEESVFVVRSWPLNA
jgi:4-diphosphocytidyl-2-C-methyl-D-erythritol kinase